MSHSCWRRFLLRLLQVHQSVLLIYGQSGDPASHPIDGAVYVSNLSASFPSTKWPLHDSHFKALVRLAPGMNRLRFDVVSPKLVTNGASAPQHCSFFQIGFLPLQESPPLHLVMLLGKDSPGTYDAVPERREKEGNDLDTAIRKYRTAAHLWQAFTAEQMFRYGFGRRCFRFEEEWQLGSLSLRDRETSTMRSEAKVHVIRTEKTTAELRDLKIAQQYGPAPNKTELFNIALDAVKSYFKTAPGQKRYVAAMILDTHWDTESQVITAHAALGGIDPQVSLAICGSHALQSFPRAIDEVVSAFTDCTKTDTQFVANDGNDCGSSWEAATSNMGAFLHEVGHLFGCPHQEYGIMFHDFVHFNRTFLTRTSHATRTNEKGLQICLPKDEAGWHRRDALRFRCHPCFRIPNDPPMAREDGVKVWAIDNGRILVTAGSGVAFIELQPQGEQLCTTWIEYPFIKGEKSLEPERQVLLTESDLRNRLPEKLRKKTLRIDIHSRGGGKHTVEDISELTSKKALVKMAKGQIGFRGSKIGESKMAGSTPEEIIMHNAVSSTRVLMSIKVYHCQQAIEGMEFVYEDRSTQLFGKRGSTADEFFLGKLSIAHLVKQKYSDCHQIHERARFSSGSLCAQDSGLMAFRFSPAWGGVRPSTETCSAALGE